MKMGSRIFANIMDIAFVPRGFAHGFGVISQTADFVYKCDAYYMPDDECD